MDLPVSFLNDMRDLLGSGYNDYLDSLKEQPCSGLRVNTLKTTPEYILSKFGPLERIPWTDNGFYIRRESDFTKTPYYFAGLFYIQEPSAMTPAAILGTKPGEKILDLCAAPGGKATQIGSDLKGKGVLYSNDISASRARALLKNTELSGIGNSILICEESGRLKTLFPAYFDRILIDAPCSGEGMFRKHPAVLNAYLEHGRDFYCPVQKKLLDDASVMLKPGGTLVYSTCTYNRREDEEQIRLFLSSHPDFAPDPIPLREGFTDSAEIPGCIRLFPHTAKGEGHFAAKMKKRGQDSVFSSGIPIPNFIRKDNKICKDAESFLKTIKRTWDTNRFSESDGYISYLPENEEIHSGLRYLRTGLLIGQVKNNRFKPSQALAMNLEKEECTNPVLFDADDPRVIRYLKGETIEAPDSVPGKGYRLLCADSFPLGFIKTDGGRMKNMLLPGWRWV